MITGENRSDFATQPKKGCAKEKYCHNHRYYPDFLGKYHAVKNVQKVKTPREFWWCFVGKQKKCTFLN